MLFHVTNKQKTPSHVGTKEIPCGPLAGLLAGINGQPAPALIILQP